MQMNQDASDIIDAGMTAMTDAGMNMNSDAGPCVPQCDNRDCGDDSCGGSCGECTGGQLCSSGGQCLPFAPGGVTHRMSIARNANTPRPGVNTRHTATNFGTTIRRVSNRSEIPVEGDDPGVTHLGGYETQIYSQLQAFSADQSHILLAWDDLSFYLVRRVSDFSRVEGIDLSGANDPRWHPIDPDIIVHWDTNADTTLRYEHTNIQTKQTTTITTLAEYTRICGVESWEELSHDGTWVVGMAQRQNTNWTGNCRDYPETNDVFAYNLAQNRYGARINIQTLNEGGPCRPNDRPDWVGVSPLGDYILIQWVAAGTDRCNGLEAFDIESGNFAGRITDHHQHGDIGLVTNWQSAPANQRQFFMSFENNLGADNNDYPIEVAYTFLPGSTSGRGRINSTSLKLASGLPDHISCQGPAGYCLLTTGPGDGPNSWSPFEEEIVVFDLNGNVNRLAHHRSSECAYWAQPRATWSKNGQYALFSSDWGINSCNVDGSYPDWLRLGRVDPYLIEVTP